MKYKYGNIENAKPGDVIESIGNDHNTTAGKLYIIQEGSSNSSIGHFISDSGEKTDGICLLANFWKLVLTKPGSDAKIGDTVICIKTYAENSDTHNANCKQGDTYIVTSCNSEFLNGYYTADYLVLCQEEEEEESVPELPETKWEAARRIKDSNFILPKDERIIGNKFIVVNAEGYDSFKKGEILTFIRDDNSACPEFKSDSTGVTSFFYWYRLEPLSETEPIDTYKPKYAVGDSIQTDYDWYKDSIVKIIEIYTGVDGELYYRYDSCKNGNKGGVNFCTVFDEHSEYYKIDTPSILLHDVLGMINPDVVKTAATWYTPTQESPLYEAHNTKVKGDLMDHNNITISMTAKEFAKYEKENKPETPKTELERASKTVTKWYDENGHCYNQTGETKKQASKELQHPTKLGHTFRTYTITASETTAIPTASAL